MAEYVIETQQLTRYFGRTGAVRELDLAVPRGCVFGFLGRNGAGKTTTIRMLLGLLEPTRGAATVLRQDSRTLSPAGRARIGYLAEGHHVYGWMRVAECGRFQRSFYARWNEELYRNVVEYFGLEPDTRVRDLSRGQRAGLCLALTLAPAPELLLLDDPALGLDPVARRALLEAMVYVTRQADRTIFFSSHLVDDVERVADRIAILDHGRLRACCTVDEFRRRVQRVVLHFSGPPPAVPDIPGLLHARRTERELSLTIANCDERTEALLGRLGAARREPVALDLEEAFIDYVGVRGAARPLVPESGGAA